MKQALSLSHSMINSPRESLRPVADFVYIRNKVLSAKLLTLGSHFISTAYLIHWGTNLYKEPLEQSTTINDIMD